MMRTAMVTAGLLVALGLPLAAQATTTSTAPVQHVNLQTRLFDRYSTGEFQGQLKLTIYPNGIVQGTYRPSDGNIRMVTGGIEGKTIWLEIGQSHPLHLTGTFADGVLDMTAAANGTDTFWFQSVGNVTPGK